MESCREWGKVRKEGGASSGWMPDGQRSIEASEFNYWGLMGPSDAWYAGGGLTRFVASCFCCPQLRGRSGVVWEGSVGCAHLARVKRSDQVLEARII